MEHSVRVGVLGGSRRRLDGIGLGCLFLDAGQFGYHAGAAGKLVLAGLGIDIGGKLVFAGLDAAAAGAGTPGPGSGRPRRARPGLPLLVISGGRPG